MIKALKVALVLYSVLGIIIGLVMMFAPEKLPAMGRFQTGSEFMFLFMGMLGGSIIAISVFIIIAARDPLRNIRWVQFTIVITIINVVVAGYSILLGYVSFAETGSGLIVDAVFALALISLYPGRLKNGRNG